MELWKQIKNYEGLYDISSMGRVYSHITNRFLKPSRVNGHYSSVVLYKNKVGKSREVHRLVSESFLTRDNFKLQVNHRDGDKYNNKVENLEWVTAKENSTHAISNGFFNPKGENQGGSKLKEKDVIDILSRIGFEKIKSIAKDYGVMPSTVSLIKSGRNWSHISKHIATQRDFIWKHIEKPCTKCKQVRPISDFYKDERNKSGLKSWCRECFNKDIQKRKGSALLRCKE